MHFENCLTMAHYNGKHFGFLLELFVLLSALLVHSVHAQSSKIQQNMFSSPEEKKDVIVTFGTSEELKGIVHQITSSYSGLPKEERIYAMYKAMVGYSTKCQSSAQSYLNSASYAYHDMWSSNTMIIRNADHDCTQKLAELSDVTSIRLDSTFPLIDPVIGAGSDERFESVENDPERFTIGSTWGLAFMRVLDAWKYNVYTGYGYESNLNTGRGIVVSAIDTGVNAEHVSLSNNFRGYAGWHDGYNLSTTPEDLNGHGTHTMGTICGQNGIGVAPGAQWIACRGCHDRECLESALLKCCQWILCPHDYNAKKGAPESYRDCSTAPDLVSNSWGGGQGDKTFERCALALRAAGIIPVWAIGNDGPNCTTASSPGDLEYVIGVGATNENDETCKFSSRGSTVEGLIKPDISAPGMHVTSSWHNGTNAFFTISGTSMATPHVAGLIALILERCRLPYKTVLHVLQTTADRENLGKSIKVCGGTKSDQFPNNFYGYGRVNALEAIKKVVQICHLNNNFNSNYNYQNYASYYGSGSGVGSYARNNAHSLYQSTPVKQAVHGYGPYQKNYGYYLNY